MLDLNFHNQVTTNLFRRGNAFSFSNLVETPFLIRDNAKEVPLIYKEPDGYHRNRGYLVYSNDIQFRGVKASRLQLVELFNISPIIIKVNFNAFTLAVGKGFLGVFGDGGMLIPLVCVLTPNRDNVTVSDLTYVVSRVILTTDYRPMYAALSSLIEGHQGDTLFTPSIQKYVGEIVRIPLFSNMTQRKQYVQQLLLRCFGKLKEVG